MVHERLGADKYSTGPVVYLFEDAKKSTEGEGFEPPVRFPVQTISRLVTLHPAEFTILS